MHITEGNNFDNNLSIFKIKYLLRILIIFLSGIMISCEGGGGGGDNSSFSIDSNGQGVEESDIFRRENNALHFSARIGSDFPSLLQNQLNAYPEVNTLVFHSIPGSIDDGALRSAGHLIRSRGIATHAAGGARIMSGGVYLFLAGTRRTADGGSNFGVHSWRSNANTSLEGRNLDAGDPQHQPFLQYLSSIGISQDFYWFSINAAPSSGMHWMSGGELARYGVLTN